MTTQTEALKQLLEALDKELPHNMKHIAAGQRFNARTALAHPEQEPVGEAYLCDECQTPFDGAYECPSCGHNTAVKEPVYTTPPQRKPWVSLTDEDLAVCGDEDDVMLARYWERVCKENNNA